MSDLVGSRALRTIAERRGWQLRRGAANRAVLVAQRDDRRLYDHNERRLDPSTKEMTR